MYNRIFVRSDGSERMTSAVRYTLNIAASHGSTVYILDTETANNYRLIRIGANKIERLLDSRADIVSQRTKTLDDGEVVSESQEETPQISLADYVHTYDINLTVIGTSKRRSLREYLFGSTIISPLETATTSILTIQSDTEVKKVYPYDSVLILVDKNDRELVHVERGAALAAQYGASVHLLSVVNEGILGTSIWSTEVVDQLKAEASGIINKSEAIVSRAGVDDVVTHVAHGSIIEEARSYASAQDTDLVVTGVSPSKQLDEQIIRAISRPVLNCRIQ